MEDKPKITSAFPGFRFHPTEEELLEFYLKNLALGKKLSQQFSNVIGFVNIYRHDPQDLPRLAIIGEREWYFFVPRDRKQSNGGRLNRTTKHGFWKATGSDRKVVTLSDPKRVIGYKKTLVFYQGRAPRGTKTDWIMNEYRLPDNSHLPKDVVLCKVYRKATSLKVLEQRAAKEEQQGEVDEEGYTMMYSSSAHQLLSDPSSSPLSSSNRPDYYYDCTPGQQQEEESIAYPTGSYYLAEPYSLAPKVLLEETQDDLMFFNQLAAAGGGDLHTAAGNQCKLSADGGGLRSGCGSSLMLPFGLQELQVPKLEMDSAQDLHWASWLDHILKTPTAELLNF